MSHGLLNASLLRFALTSSLPYYDGHLKKVISAMFGETIDSDKEALKKLLTWLAPMLGGSGFIFDGDLSEDKIDVVNRLMQDKGLASVTYGGISEDLILDVVDRIINETR